MLALLVYQRCLLYSVPQDIAYVLTYVHPLPTPNPPNPLTLFQDIAYVLTYVHPLPTPNPILLHSYTLQDIAYVALYSCSPRSRAS